MSLPAKRSIPKQFKFEQPKSVPVVVNFNGGQVTSDAGLSLIAEIDKKLQITSRLAGCFHDYRQANRMLHPIESLIGQRIYGLEQEWNTIIDVHLKGYFQCSQAAAKQMIKQGIGGSIIMNSSIAGVVGIAGCAAYTAASKPAI